ncbi:hypothetical protein EV44_g5999 [Erysiphe necator]|uniref:Uncharacterized protein n=1 Tax=Uncinula necator TaxID=52586 RepID=A0A0B1P5A6_UNCNE|nr:hypothetical protein EV44_g5999 [Erysiphe necator]
MELSSTSDVTNGYQCSHEFISDELLQDALKIALEATGKRSIYPAPYRGNLFPENDEYKIWPIMKNGKLYRSGSANIGIYFIIYDKQGELKEAVVRGFNNNFIRCMRTRKAPTAPASDPLNKLFVPASKQGYMCGRAFFEDKHLQEVAEIARGFSSNDKLKTKFKKMRFPIERNGELFNRPYLLFPIVRFGKFYGKGNSGWYRVALEVNYKVICAAMIIDGNLKPCEKTTIKGKIQHDTSDYLCGKRVFPNEVLLRSTEEACVKMNGYYNNFYPASYSGPSYGPEGPYYTYPIIENHQDRLRAGQYRVVINASCEFLGALTKYNYGSETRLVKCHRLEDNPNMKFMPVDLNESISEHPILLG